MAKLPESVQRQVAAADALYTSQSTETAPPPEADVAPVEQGQSPPPDAPPQDNPPPAQPPEAAPDQKPPVPDVWEQRYKSLQGLFNQKVPELQRQNEELQTNLKAAIARLDQAAEQKSEPASQPAADPKDVDAFGQDLVDMVQRQTRAAMGAVATKLDSVVKGYETRLASLEQMVKGAAQTASMTAEEVFFSRLQAAVPDWETVNRDQRFLTWLAEVDPVYGQPRQTALAAAQQSLNVERAANVFKAFKTTLPQPAKANSLEKQISPGAGAASPAPQNTPKMYAAQEVTRFYDALRRGEFRGREAEADKLEQMYNLALQEGRIR